MCEPVNRHADFMLLRLRANLHCVIKAVEFTNTPNPIRETAGICFEK